MMKLRTDAVVADSGRTPAVIGGDPSIPYSILFTLSLLTLVVTLYVDELAGRVLLGALVVTGLVLRRLSLTGAVGLLLPFMFVISVGIKFNFGLVDFLVPVLLFSTVVKCWRNQHLTRVLRLPLYFSVLFLAWAGVSFILAPLLNGYALSNARFLSETFKLAVCFALFGCISVLLADELRRSRIDILHTWSAMATASGSLGVLELFTDVSSGGRYTAGFNNPNLLSLFLVTSLAVVALRRMALSRGPVGLDSLMILGGILATGGRGSFVAAGVFVLLIPLLAGVRGALSAFGSVLLTLVAGTLLAAYGRDLPVMVRVLESNRTVEEDIRVTLWTAAVQLWSENPLFGQGLGQFAELSTEFTNSNIGYVAHNTYLSFLAETGIVGAAAITGLFLLVALRLIRLRTSSSVFFVAGVVWLPILANMFTLNAENARFVWVFLGVCHAMFHVYLRDAAPAPHQPVNGRVGSNSIDRSEKEPAEYSRR